MATQDYVDDKIAEHEQSRRHPDASLTAKGFTQLSSATNSTSETLAATPKAVKAAYDLANGKYTAQDATTARKGLVQLSSATNSTSETLAATPKAVKAAYDLANGKYTAQDATTARKGLVQLSSATNSDSETLAATPKAVKTAYDLANGKYTAQDATTARKGLVQLSSATNSDSETLAATPKAVKSAYDNAEKRLQKDQNGADIPDKDRFLSNINVYSKGEVDKKKGMRLYVFNAPSNAVGGKWYPVIFRRSTGSTGELASRVVITTTSAGGDYAMNNCEFNGMVMPGGWTDRGSYAAGYFSTYQTNERAIHSIVTSLKEDDVCSVFYVEGRAFPVRVFAEEGLTVIVPTQDYTVGQTTYKWGATNPATESTNAQAILDFNNGRGFYCSHSIFGINAIFSGNLGIGTVNALGGNSIVLGDNDTGFKQNGDGVLDAYANGVHVFRFKNGSAISLKGIQAGESKLFTLSSANTAARNASFNLWGNSSRPTVAELGDDSGWHFYSQRNTDNSVIFAVNGQIQPSNWDNIDSRYVKDVRLGSQQYYGVNNWQTWNFQCPSGHVLSGINVQDTGSNSADNIAGVYYRPVQKYINGTWYNVASV
ncbi:tail fiber protein [Escherichia coli]